MAGLALGSPGASFRFREAGALSGIGAREMMPGSPGLASWAGGVLSLPPERALPVLCTEPGTGASASRMAMVFSCQSRVMCTFCSRAVLRRTSCQYSFFFQETVGWFWPGWSGCPCCIDEVLGKVPVHVQPGGTSMASAFFRGTFFPETPAFEGCALPCSSRPGLSPC